MAAEAPIARVILHHPATSWAHLLAIESCLGALWPDAIIWNGELGNIHPVSIADRQHGGWVSTEQIREFVVRGAVGKVRFEGTSVESILPVAAIAEVQVFYPEPSVPELERIVQTLQQAWPSQQHAIEYGSFRHSGLPPDEAADTQNMIFVVRGVEEGHTNDGGR